MPPNTALNRNSIQTPINLKTRLKWQKWGNSGIKTSKAHLSLLIG